MEESPKPSAASSLPYCDLVMKGGITSGVVYPKAIEKLAQEYKLKNIGGTSAGAIAAAFAAAAEFRRRNSPGMSDTTGFAAIGNIGDELKRKPNGKTSVLLGLFQPSAATRALFTILTSTLNKENGRARLAAALAAALRIYWLRALVSFLIVFFLVGAWPLREIAAGELAIFVILLLSALWCARSASHWIKALSFVTLVLIAATLLAWKAASFFALASLLGALAVAVAAALIAVARPVYRIATKALPTDAQGFGLCTGMAPEDHDRSDLRDYTALTRWLHKKIQEVAGLPEDRPLTFGQLWAAPGFPPDGFDTQGVRPKSINLQLVTTNLTHGRPYVLPFEDQNSRLFFKKSELAPLFPKEVFEVLCQHAKRYTQASASDPVQISHDDILELPSPEQLPVLFAVRLSLSFPVLLSAIPLWALDYEPEQRDIRRCWFSDGGISSNFPIHFFDGLLPLWPTFGFMLEPQLKYRPDTRVFMPKRNGEGRGENWNRFDDPAQDPSLERLLGFLGALFSSAKDWNDNTLARMPGVRERVVRMHLKKDEGGLNLDMKDEVIADLVNCGDLAAREILRRFVKAETIDGSKYPMDWSNHSWVRLNSVLDSFASLWPGLKNALNDPARYFALVNEDWHDDQFKLDANGQQTVQKFLDLLKQFANVAPAVDAVTRPAPRGELRTRPPL